MWPGVEPVRGQYNQTYLDIVAEIVEEASSYGIYTLADMHEDVLSERFCGDAPTTNCSCCGFARR